MTMGRDAMQVTLMVAAPLLLVALIIGLLVSIFQAATQINESTLSFIPKLVGIFVALVVAGPWMLSVMLDYMRQIFTGIPGMIG
jgi:flagellar biosynthetic protein FliQ